MSMIKDSRHRINHGFPDHDPERTRLVELGSTSRGEPPDDARERSGAGNCESGFEEGIHAVDREEAEEGISRVKEGTKRGGTT